MSQVKTSRLLPHVIQFQVIFSTQFDILGPNYSEEGYCFK